MLSVSRWAQATAQVVHDQIQGSHCATWKSVPNKDKGEYMFEFPALWSSLCINPLQQVAGFCEPFYSGLHEDVDHITELLTELEGRYSDCESEDEDDELDSEDFPDPLEWDLTPRARYISTHPSIPSITVTPCQSQHAADYDLCRVPLQDSAFGQQLTVPTHPTFNDTHPPGHAPSSSVSQLNAPEFYWWWNDGHWEAVLPSLSQQSRRGLYSIPLPPTRRKGVRSSGSHVPRRFSHLA